MIHYSCDRCKREIDPQIDLHYVVRVEIELENDHAKSLDLDFDPLQELDQLLEESQQPSHASRSHDHPSCMKYDLCVHCMRQLAKNPLGRDVIVPIGFSQN